MRIKATLFAIIILLVVSPFFIQPNGLNNVKEEVQRTSWEVSYTDSGPILIEEDDDFGVLGFPGEGSEFSPYLIDDLNFTSNDVCITIRNTRAYFNITNCYFAPEYEDYTIGIVLENVTNACIGSNIFSNKTTAVQWNHVNDSRCVDNIIIGNVNSGVSLSGCYDSVVELNQIVGNDENRGNGVYLFDSISCNISENEIANSCIGIKAAWAENCTIDQNQLHNFDYGPFVSMDFPSAIQVQGSPNCTIRQNEISESPVAGIILVGPADVHCIENTLTGCGFFTYGLMPGNPGFSTIGDMVNNKPVLYVWNQTNLNIDGSLYGQIILHEAKFCSIAEGQFNEASVGISLSFCTNCTIEDTESSGNHFAGALMFFSTNCTFNNLALDDNSRMQSGTNLVSSVWVFSSQNAKVTNCEITNSQGAGLLITQSALTVVTDNTFMKNGIFIMGGMGPTAVEDFYIIEENNTINGKQFGYFYNETDKTVDGTLYGQIYAVNSSRVSIVGGDFSEATSGVAFVFTSNCSLESATMNQNSFYGLQNLFSTNTSIINNSIDDNPYSAIHNAFSESSTFLNNSVCGNGHDIPEGQTMSTLALSSYDRLSCNTISQNRYGIALDGSNITVHKNNISCNGMYGILVSNADFFNISSNCIAGNFLELVVSASVAGIYVSAGTYGVIHNNSIYSNSGYGIMMGSLSATNNSAYWNEIGWNGLGNAADGGMDNLWDDNVTTGNAWSDYVGSGTYPIMLSSSVDRYPSALTDITVPTVLGPDDTIFEYGTSENVLVWNASDNYPGHFIVYQNGTVIENRTWCFKPIEVGLEPLDLGTYNLTIVVYDGEGNTASDTVIVESVDSINPTIDNPADIEYSTGQTGNNIIWHGSDLNPASYEIFQDEISVKTGVWNFSAESIVINVDGLLAAEYNYTILVTDMGGNTAVDEVIVTVVETTSPSIDSPEDIEYAEFDTDNMIVWHPNDANPESYVIYFEETPLKSGLWNTSSESISISVDGLSLGIFNYTILVTDQYDNTAQDEVLVIVTDGTPPVVNDVPDVTFTEGSTGHNITWLPTDLHPDSFEIFLDGSIIRSGLWNSSGESIFVALDSLDPGTYNYTVIMTDVGGNTISDTVIVTVTEATTTSTTTTTTTGTSTTTDGNIPPMTILLLSAVAGIIIIFVVILLRVKK